jgi:ornithine cyclodeaminase
VKLTLLNADAIRQALPMPRAVEAMKDAFAELSSGAAVVPQRLAVDVAEAGATSLFMPAYLPSGGLGAKVVSVFPRNRERGLPVIHGLVVLLDPATGAPAALLDGTFLTAWRTGAASGAATDLLARRDARTLALFGCGAQARTQLLAVAAVREIEEVRVYARRRPGVEAFLEEMAPRLDARLVAAGDPGEAVRGADVVCTATTSAVPVFDGRDLADGSHLNGVGSYTLDMQEVDTETVGRSRVFVDSHDAALEEAGDLVIAERAQRTEAYEWTELGDVVTGRRPGRRSDNEITFFKSVGVAVQDVKAATAALERARELGLGQEAEL